MVQSETSGLLEKFGNFIRPVATKPAKVLGDVQSDKDLFDAELPFPIEILPRIVTSKPDTDNVKSFSLRTPFAGRADYLLPFIFKLKDKSGTVMSAIMVKGSGSLEALEKTGSPYSEKGDGEIEGAASINNLRLDAANSKILADAGIRTRVAIGVYQLKEIELAGKIYTPQELLSAGIVTKPEDLPAIGIFASRTAFRLEDINMLLRYNRNLDSPQIESLITYLVRTTEYDDAPEFANFSQKYKSHEVTAMSPEARKEVMSDFALALARVLGRQAAKFGKIKAVKLYKNDYGNPEVNETENNLTCLAGSVDNSQIKFDATADEIVKYQKDIFGFASLIPEVMNMKSTDMALLAIEHRTKVEFIEGYLDEIVPDWKTSKIGEEFITLQSKDLSVDLPDARRAYWITKTKFDGIKKGMQDKVTKHDLAELTYKFLSGIFNDEMYEKTGKFVQAFFSEYDPIQKT